MDRTFPLKRSANSGGYAGVYKHGNGWRVLIKDGDKLKHIGSYPTRELAAEAYAIAAARRAAESFKRRKARATSKNKHDKLAFLRILHRLALESVRICGEHNATFDPGKVEAMMRDIASK